MTRESAGRRSSCPISCALDIFGDRWTLLVLRDLLLFGKKRYREFLAGGEGIASNILSERLRRLEMTGIITRETDPDDRRQVIYTATEKGTTLVPILLEIAAWGASQDAETAAPAGFAAAFYADREAFHADARKRIATLSRDKEP